MHFKFQTFAVFKKVQHNRVKANNILLVSVLVNRSRTPPGDSWTGKSPIPVFSS